MSNRKPEKQVSLAGMVQPTPPAKPKKKPFKWGRLVAVVLVLAVLVGGGFLLFGGEEGPALTAREMVEYTVTPDELSGKVSYYALGVTGQNATDRMDMVAVMWCDRKNETAGILQVPVATYIGKDTGFAVSAVGDVWGNPQPELFCSTCRVRVAADAVKDQTHTVCGSATEERIGSAYGDLIRVFNDQYGLPIDNYLVIPRAGLVELIDHLGGVDVQLDKDMTLADVKYKKGVQLLSGAAAVDYAITDGYKGTPDSDVARMARQRQVLSALLQRLGRCKAEELYSVNKNTGAVQGAFGKLMLGSDPVRFNTTSFGKARLLGISESAANGLKLSEAIARFAREIGSFPLDKVTCSVLPGEAVKDGTATVYAVNADQAAELLNQQMNPYGLTLDATTVKIPELIDDQKDVKVTTVTLDTVAVDQSQPSDTAGGTGE